MDHFDIVFALAGSALDADNSRVLQQVERLRVALETSDKEQAAKLARLLSRSSRRQTMAPMAFEEMRASADAVRRRLPGEVLSRSVPLPHDKETGAPLVRVRFPEDGPVEAPILATQLAAAIEDLLTEWRHADELVRVGAKPHTRCLIFGAPGVGKTRLARYLAYKLELPLVEARLDGLVSSFLGTTARNIGALFDFANRYRCALFLDEFDAIAKARDDAQEVGEIKRVVNSLLQSLDARGSGGLTLAATNHEHLLDSAVWRRFEARIEIPKPNDAARREMLTHFVKPLRLTGVQREFLVWATEGMSGADIEALVASGKRFLVLHGETISAAGEKNETSQTKDGRKIIAALRQQAALNARLFDKQRQSVLAASDEEIMAALEDVGIAQIDVADLFGVNQSTVSRLWAQSRKRRRVTSLESAADD